MQLISNIDHYIQQLRQDYNLSITLHPSKNETLINNSSLIKYNFHNSGYCYFLKTNESILKKCVTKQSKLDEKLKTCTCFTGVCHAGVKERVYGIWLNNKYLGFISVSGYKAPKNIYEPRVRNVCYTYKHPVESTFSLYDKLKENFPPEELLDNLLFPLVRMIELGNLQIQNSANNSDSTYLQILRHLNVHFYEDISVEKLAKHFFVSPSYISHIFKQNNGKDIRTYLSFLRIEFAKKLLVSTQNSIAEIAQSCNFFDSSYFCKVFKKFTGVTPIQYRKTKSTN